MNVPHLRQLDSFSSGDAHQNVLERFSLSTTYVLMEHKLMLHHNRKMDKTSRRKAADRMTDIKKFIADSIS